MKNENLQLGNNESVETYREKVAADIKDHGKTYGKVAADCRELSAAIVAASTHASIEQKKNLASLLNTIDSTYHVAGMVWDSFRTMLRKETKEHGIVLDIYPIRGASSGSRYLAKQIKLSGVAAKATVEPVQPIASENTAGHSQQDVAATETVSAPHGLDDMENLIKVFLQKTDVSPTQLLALAVKFVPDVALEAAMARIGYVSLAAADAMVANAIAAEKTAAAKRSGSKSPRKVAARKTA
jgi:hypothetical protein